MKIKVISRSTQEFVRERSNDTHKIQRNIAPELHPFERAREYTRARNATKLGKLFAKPFVCALDGHYDSIWSMATVPTRLSVLLSGSCDGEIRSWNLTRRCETWSVQAHRGFVRGLSVDAEGEHIVSCGDDKLIKVWSLDPSRDQNGDIQPLHSFMSKTGLTGLEHQWNSQKFATSGIKLDLWDMSRSEPLHSFSWGADTINTLKFNRVETNVLASAASDRNIVLYDIRAKSLLRKLILRMNVNAICWNPTEAYHFTAASEDDNLYTFDMRRLSSALNVHKDHVNSVMSVDYSPTGKEFVSGGYDKMIRIFRNNEGHSREVYHGKRMQRVFVVKFSADNKYVISASDDTNIRLWKAEASTPIGTLLPAEKRKMNESKRLIQRFAHTPQIGRMLRHKHVPKYLKSQEKQRHIMKKSAKRKDDRRRAHSKKDSIPYVAERKKHIVAEKK